MTDMMWALDGVLEQGANDPARNKEMGVRAITDNLSIPVRECDVGC